MTNNTTTYTSSLDIADANRRAHEAAKHNDAFARLDEIKRAQQSHATTHDALAHIITTRLLDAAQRNEARLLDEQRYTTADALLTLEHAATYLLDSTTLINDDDAATFDAVDILRDACSTLDAAQRA